MSQSKTYLKFKETRSQEDLETLNSYLKRLSEISDILKGYRDWETDRKSTRLNSSHRSLSRRPSSA